MHGAQEQEEHVGMAGVQNDVFGQSGCQDGPEPGIIAAILMEMLVYGWLVAALLEEMEDLKGKARFEFCETQFRCSKCIMGG